MKRVRFVFSVAFWDLLLAGVSIGAVSWALFGHPFPWEVVRLGPRVVPAVLTVFAGALAMSVLTARLSGPGVPRPGYGRGAVIFAGTLAILAVFLFVSRAFFSRSLFGASLAVWGVALTTHRLIRRRRPWSEKVVAITDEKELIAHLNSADHAELIAVIDPQAAVAPQPFDVDATIALDLRAVVSEPIAIFVSSSDISGVTVRPFASVYEEHTGRIPLVHLAEGWEISNPLGRTSIFLPGKRAFDLLAVTLTAPIWLIVGALAALGVLLADGRPIIFKQERIGLRGKPFLMYKFRTMHTDAEAEGPRFASASDSRIVRGGSFMRRARLDELPQLWNVLKGDMSLVGPRAEQVVFAQEFEKTIPFYGYRNLIRPGITGWAQVNSGYAEDQLETVEKLTYDLYYVKHMSPVLDLQILARTIAIVTTGLGAR